jgi:hypothetical protein
VRQEMKTSRMVFTTWKQFVDKFTLIFCPENKVTIGLMTLESDRYFQGKQNIDIYTDKLEELIVLSGPHCKGNLAILRRILHLDLAKGNPKYIYKSR